MDSSLIEAPKLRCEACEGYLVPLPHRGPQHVDQAWMCGSPLEDCAMSGICLTCQKLLAWFHKQNEALGDA